MKVFSTAFALFSVVSAIPFCPDQKVVASVDLNKYQGKWYEIASSLIIRSTFERNCKCVTAEYALNATAGEVSVLNTCVKKDTDVVDRIQGVAKPVDPTSDKGRFQVSFPSVPFGGGKILNFPNYIVIKIYGDYEQVLVGAPCRSLLWILSRTPTIPEEKYNEILDYASSVGYNLGFLQVKKTIQDQCPAL